MTMEPLQPGEALMLGLVHELIRHPPSHEDIDHDDNNAPWLKIPAQSISHLLLSRYMLAFSVRQARTGLNGLVEKGFLLRTQRIGSNKGRSTYFYRLPGDI